ncbi:MAG: sugar porter family MFS transporter [Planctomycetaceae bacterium]|nr:sugar porter family MFS transporter [Planctomycetaceae bacterium]
MNQRQGSIAYVSRVCLVATLGGLLFGYDTAVIAGAIGYMKSHFAMDAATEGWATSCALAGCILGVAVAGWISDRFGRRNTLILSAVLFLVSAIGTAIPRTLTEFIIFRIVGGVGVGAASMTSPMYIAEISPARFRGRLVSVNQLAIVTGMLVVYFVNYWIAGLGDEAWNEVAGWRWMFGSEAVPAVALLVLMFTVPESPRFLCRQGKSDQAREVLVRIGGLQHAEREMAEIGEVLSHESPSLGQLVAPGMRVALWIAVVLAILQQVTGINVFLYYAPEIFKGMAGAEADAALLQTIVVGAVNLTFTVIAIWTVDQIGRKPLMIVGSTGMGLCLTALGAAACLGRADVWLLTFVLGYIACFALSVGPVTWVILSEIFPTKIRGRAMAIATFCLWTANFVVSQTFPMMDENEWLIETFNHGFPFFIYAAFCAVLAVFMIAMVPETKGKTLEEIERSWTSLTPPVLNR